MWPECVADFATAVDQSTLPHHSFKPRKELRGQSVIAGERLVIFGNKRFTHCDLFSRANQASLPVGEPERWRIGGCTLSGFYGSHREQRMCPVRLQKPPENLGSECEHQRARRGDRKSTRLNSSHGYI